MTEMHNRRYQTLEREKEESVRYQPINKTRGKVNGPKAHKKAFCRSYETLGCETSWYHFACWHSSYPAKWVARKRTVLSSVAKCAFGQLGYAIFCWTRGFASVPATALTFIPMSFPVFQSLIESLVSIGNFGSAILGDAVKSAACLPLDWILPLMIGVVTHPAKNSGLGTQHLPLLQRLVKYSIRTAMRYCSLTVLSEAFNARVLARSPQVLISQWERYCTISCGETTDGASVALVSIWCKQLFILRARSNAGTAYGLWHSTWPPYCSWWNWKCRILHPSPLERVNQNWAFIWHTLLLSNYIARTDALGAIWSSRSSLRRRRTHLPPVCALRTAQSLLSSQQVTGARKGNIAFLSLETYRNVQWGRSQCRVSPVRRDRQGLHRVEGPGPSFVLAWPQLQRRRPAGLGALKVGPQQRGEARLYAVLSESDAGVWRAVEVGCGVSRQQRRPRGASPKGAIHSGDVRDSRGAGFGILSKDGNFVRLFQASVKSNCSQSYPLFAHNSWKFTGLGERVG